MNADCRSNAKAKALRLLLAEVVMSLSCPVTRIHPKLFVGFATRCSEWFSFSSRRSIRTNQSLEGTQKHTHTHSVALRNQIQHPGARVEVGVKSKARRKHPGGGFVFSSLLLQAHGRYSNVQTQRTKRAYWARRRVMGMRAPSSDEPHTFIPGVRTKGRKHFQGPGTIFTHFMRNAGIWPKVYNELRTFRNVFRARTFSRNTRELFKNTGTFPEPLFF